MVPYLLQRVLWFRVRFRDTRTLSRPLTSSLFWGVFREPLNMKGHPCYAWLALGSSYYWGAVLPFQDTARYRGDISKDSEYALISFFGGLGVPL